MYYLVCWAFVYYSYFMSASIPLIALLRIPLYLIVLVTAVLVFLLHSFFRRYPRAQNAILRQTSLNPLYAIASIPLFLSICNLLVVHDASQSVSLVLISCLSFTSLIAPIPLWSDANSKYLFGVFVLLGLGAMSALILSNLYGMKPLLEFSAHDRSYYFIPFSLSPLSGDVLLTGLFRPSAIYDEPGSFFLIASLFACVDITSIGLRLRHILFIIFIAIVSTALSSIFILLGLGFINSAYTLFHSFRKLRPTFLFRVNKKVLKIAAIGIVAFFFLLYSVVTNPYLYQVIDELLFSRLGFDHSLLSSGLFSGDNRTSSILDSLRFSFASLDNFLLGQLVVMGDDSIGTINTGGDPLTILVYSGFFSWVFYLVVIVYLVIFTLKSFLLPGSRALVSAGAMLLLLLLHKPYTNFYPYIPSLIITLRYWREGYNCLWSGKLSRLARTIY
jgi:hypothetical protein